MGDGFDVESGFVADLAAQPVFNGLAEFEDAAGWFPAAVVAALDGQGPVVVFADDGGDANAVPGSSHAHLLDGPAVETLVIRHLSYGVSITSDWITDPDGNRIELVQWPTGHADGITKADFPEPTDPARLPAAH